MPSWSAQPWMGQTVRCSLVTTWAGPMAWPLIWPALNYCGLTRTLRSVVPPHYTVSLTLNYGTVQCNYIKNVFKQMLQRQELKLKGTHAAIKHLKVRRQNVTCLKRIEGEGIRRCDVMLVIPRIILVPCSASRRLTSTGRTAAPS